MALKAYDEEYALFGHSIPEVNISNVSISFFAVLSTFLLIVSVTFLIFIIYATRTREGQLETAEDCENRNDLVAEYLTIYIFPLAVLNYSSLPEVSMFLALFVAIGAIQIRSSRLYINPILTLFGFSVYQAKINGEQRLILSKEKLARSDTSVKTTELSNGVYVTTS